MKLEKICIHKGRGCSREEYCDGKGTYRHGGKETKCHKVVYEEIELWRTSFSNGVLQNRNR